KKGDRAVGVTGRFLTGPEGRPGSRLSVRAKRVVVAAGAYGSPLLLARSGGGRRSRQVGNNLTLHPAFRVMARFDERVRGWDGALQSAYLDAFERDRITLVGLFVPPGILAATMPGIGSEHVARAACIPHLSVFGGMIHDQAGGKVGTLFGKPYLSYRMAGAD